MITNIFLSAQVPQNWSLSKILENSIIVLLRKELYMFFPEKYKKPVLQSIVEASENGWSATCKSGDGPGSGGLLCDNGPNAGAGAGKGTSNLLLYSNPDSIRLFNTDDVGSGI